MKLTDYTDYTLRVLLYLAVRGEGLSKIADIAEAYGISKSHLMRIVRQLAERGWVETVRGRNGGVRLHAESITLKLGNIVRLTESDFALAPCLPGRQGKGRACVIVPHCRVRIALEAATRAFFDELDRYTIGDLAQPEDSLAELLGRRTNISANGNCGRIDG
ncbi:Rrf2 family transcriptional regulator [Burkholderia sp. SRS-W-2-2016]|uniref:RrF2 family transcriptional regulator n=1 Tax=Burkholderia sp. SRS-W-2-2016 TaxID=1926878 RepID=UPI00094AA85C|nr:Rrf2 family transcriptional regulator [Burkholderia sp. SRS-W-2-2016]OLL28243.1 Rrf2 family transcriptional regulator [Burkholderia sp. SRS-W-2-2016]